MSRYKIFLVLVFLLLTVTCPLSTSFAHSQTIIIEITSSGFQPQFVTLDDSSAVIFVNKDTKEHWPASDIHPTHDLYPEFDPQRALSPGESWAFKPSKAGLWQFHDHLSPHLRGTATVTVEGGTKETVFLSWFEKIKVYFQQILTNFQRKFEPEVSLDTADFTKLGSSEQFPLLEKYADSKGADKAWQFIKDTYKDQGGSTGNIHDLAHLSGSLLFENLGFEGLKHCSANFAFGCYHGFLDKAFSKSLDKLSQAHDGCSKLAPTLSGPVASCIHGIGHGVASFYSVSDLKKALTTCRQLSSGNEYCFDGVFMEFARSTPDGFYKKDDPLYPCNQLEEDYGYTYSHSCGRNQPSVLLSRFKMGFSEVVSHCLSSSSKPFKEACISSLGFSLAASANTDSITAGCQQFLEPEYISECIKSAAGELVFQEAPGWDQKSKELCSSLQNATECLNYVESLVSDYHRKR